MVRIEIQTDNAAFDGNRWAEVARILREVAQHASMGNFAMDDSFTMNLRDLNGNVVGRLDSYGDVLGKD